MEENVLYGFKTAPGLPSIPSGNGRGHIDNNETYLYRALLTNSGFGPKSIDNRPNVKNEYPHSSSNNNNNNSCITKETFQAYKFMFHC